MKLFEHICLGAISAAAVFLMVEWGLAARGVRISTAKAETAIESTLSQVNGVMRQTAAFEDEAHDTIGAFSAQISQQNKDWVKAQLEFYKTIADTKEIIVRTDKSLNDVLVPQLSAALDSTMKLSNTAAVQLTHTMNELQPTFDSFAKAAAGAAETMNDPRIGEAIGHLAETSDHAAGAAANTEKATAHVEGAAGDVQTFVHRETTRRARAWNTVRAFWMWFAGPAAQVATAVK